MATCKDCLHCEACTAFSKIIHSARDVETGCEYFKDRSLFLELPCRPGTHLWRITTPYRGEPKVTEFIVRNFRTAGKRRQLQLEVQALNVPGTNWMRYQDFYLTAEEAEKALAERRADHD